MGGWWSRGHRGDKGKKGVGRTRERERGRDGKRGEREKERMSEREREREMERERGGGRGENTVLLPLCFIIRMWWEGEREWKGGGGE